MFEDKFKNDMNMIDWNIDWKRRNDVLKWISFYNNLQMWYTEQEIIRRFPKTHKDIIKYAESTNLTQRIIDDISILFQEPASLKILNDNENIKNNFHQMLQEAQFNPTMNKVNHLEKLTYKVGVQPVWRNDKVELDIITQDRCFVWTNPFNPKEITDLFIQINAGMNVTKDNPQNVYIRWNKDFQSIVEIDGGANEKLAGKGTITNEHSAVENPYGQIPVIWFSTDVYDQFWPIKGQPIVKVNESVNIDLTHLNLIYLFQTFSTLVINESQNDRVNNKENGAIKFGPSHILKLKNSVAEQTRATAEYISPVPKITEYETTIDNSISRLAASYGLDVSHYKNKSTNNVESGYKLKLANTKILKKTKSDRQYYLPSMKELIYLMMEVYTINNNEQNILSTDNEVKIDFKEITFDISPVELEQVRVLKTNQGIWSPILSIMEDNPDLNEGEAIERYQKIQEYKNLTNPVITPTIDLGITEG